MGEKRKPSTSMLLKKRGKTIKIELFSRDLWDDYMKSRARTEFRIRVNGKWADITGKWPRKYISIWEFRDVLWRSFFKGLR